MSRILFAEFFAFFLLYSLHLTSHASPLTGSNVKLAFKGNYPFVVSISRNIISNVGKEEQNHICGGALITLSHVLTADHCIEDHNDYRSLVVKVNSTDLRKAIPHEIYYWYSVKPWLLLKGEENILHHDIAVVKLVKPVNKSIRLPIMWKTPANQLYGKKATIVGWGPTNNNLKTPIHLRMSEINILHHEESAIHMQGQQWTPAEIPLLFTKRTPHVLLQCGDSGGPLIISHWEIIGINLASCNPTDDPRKRKYQNIHASINYERYKEFIELTIKE